MARKRVVLFWHTSIVSFGCNPWILHFNLVCWVLMHVWSAFRNDFLKRGSKHFKETCLIIWWTMWLIPCELYFPFVRSSYFWLSMSATWKHKHFSCCLFAIWPYFFWVTSYRYSCSIGQLHFPWNRSFPCMQRPRLSAKPVECTTICKFCLDKFFY